MEKELEMLKRRVRREVAARKQAERILEEKALKLYEANNKLLELNANLERTIQKRTQALEEAKLVAEKAQQAEQQFLANMSHEIRTPLNAVIGMAHLLYETNPTAEQREYLDNLQSSATLLLSLISDILDFTKIESGKMEIQSNPFNLVQTIRDIQKTFELKIEGRPIVLQSHIDPKIEHLVIGDELLFHQILFNLLGNAEKFTEQGHIRIEAKVLTLFKNHLSVQFKVADTGIGIPKPKLESIFENFKQAANEKHLDHRSTGLGLSITKKIIELQGGTIEVSSEVGKGSCFTFVLGYEYSEIPNGEEVTVEPTEPHELPDRPLHILVAEDNPMNQKYIRRIFEKWDLGLEMASNGREAFEKAKGKPYDLIFMDLQMPEVNGIEAAQLILASEHPNQQTPIIALTASAISEHKKLAMEVGMQDFVTKPFTPQQLLSVIHRYTSRPTANDSLAPTTPGGQAAGDLDPYHPCLDQAHLEILYGEDWEYAADMFATFLEEIVPHFEELPPLAQAEDWERYHRIAHKVKPSLKMVGLPALHQQVRVVEQRSQAQPERNEMIQATTAILAELNFSLPILRQQLNRLQELS